MPAHLGRVHGGFARLDAATDPLHVLTRREREVALFVADGLTNIQIADRLVISRRTVEEHVSKILRKLGVRSRVAVVGLVRGRNPD
jgi:DNA-binding NarL/FixJ family response regulator